MHTVVQFFAWGVLNAVPTRLDRDDVSIRALRLGLGAGPGE
jgi:hypothetical protein